MRKSASGFSIIEVIISVGIMTVMGLALVQLIVSQNKEVKGLQEKLVLLDLQSTVQRVLSNSAFCRCFLSGNTFNTGNKTWNSFPNSMSVSYDATTCNPQGGKFFSVGEKLPLSSIQVTELSMKNINETITGSNNFVGELTIRIDNNSLVRARKDVTALVNFTVDGSGTPLSCAGSGTPTCRTVTNRGVAPYYVSDARCDPDEYLMSGGGRCEGPGSPDLCGPSLRRGYMHMNMMDADRKGWTADCFGTSPDIEDTCSEAYAVCCK